MDLDRLFIRGGSAGGYTTLAAIAFKDVFKAGASHYGVADISVLAGDTHKFESRYMNHLVKPEHFDERSPINFVEDFNEPLIIFQGDEDQIVPPNQAKMIYEALKKKGIKTELHIYEGEQHGFRKAENIIHSLKREADFYREVMR